MERNILKDLIFLNDFVSENKKAGGIEKQTADEIEKLWNKYKLKQVSEKCSIICADFGSLGHIEISNIDTAEEKQLEYKSGSYDFVSIKTSSEQVILWTDYKDIEPYNRNSGLYVGYRFSDLGQPTNYEQYREFYMDKPYKTNICFGVWGFNYNDFYKSVRFGICLKTDDVQNFITELRYIIGK